VKGEPRNRRQRGRDDQGRIAPDPCLSSPSGTGIFKITLWGRVVSRSFASRRWCHGLLLAHRQLIEVVHVDQRDAGQAGPEPSGLTRRHTTRSNRLRTAVIRSRSAVARREDEEGASRGDPPDCRAIIWQKNVVTSKIRLRGYRAADRLGDLVELVVAKREQILSLPAPAGTAREDTSRPPSGLPNVLKLVPDGQATRPPEIMS
jgi:hypothetical protein